MLCLNITCHIMYMYYVVIIIQEQDIVGSKANIKCYVKVQLCCCLPISTRQSSSCHQTSSSSTIKYSFNFRNLTWCWTCLWGFFNVMFLFNHYYSSIIVVIVHFAVPAPQNSRRLTGNWREVAIYIHFYKKADGFDATSSHICLLFICIMTEFLSICLFCAFQRTSAFVC